jgi:hypothetical protein
MLSVVLGSLALLGGPSSTWAKPSTEPQLTADLDGRPIKLADVGRWYCDDFDYPAIHCFSEPGALSTREAVVLAVTSVDYVTVYELTGFAGTYMHMSQDYNALVTIGWNDRISSLKGRNNVASHFFTDWFYGGTSYYVCCNTQLTSLGAYDNTFSSVHRD